MLHLNEKLLLQYCLTKHTNNNPLWAYLEEGIALVGNFLKIQVYSLLSFFCGEYSLLSKQSPKQVILFFFLFPNVQEEELPPRVIALRRNSVNGLHDVTYICLCSSQITCTPFLDLNYQQRTILSIFVYLFICSLDLHFSLRCQSSSCRSCFLTHFKCRNAMLRVNARQGAPTGGNSVIESLLVSSVFFLH